MEPISREDFADLLASELERCLRAREEMEESTDDTQHT